MGKDRIAMKIAEVAESNCIPVGEVARWCNNGASKEEIRDYIDFIAKGGKGDPIIPFGGTNKAQDTQPRL